MSYLRDNGIITEKQYVGKTLDEATKYAEEGGFEVRIVEIDGQSKMLTMDAKSNRINFRLNGGFITAAFGG
jgi:phosphosulfolactate synthase (CoM biosynthesis protein A)